jgi:NAD(P)H-hydrate epimerase
VTVGLPASIHPVVASLTPEATFLLLPEDLGVLARGAVPLIRDTAAECDVLLLGPGLTTQRPATELMAALLGDPAHGAAGIGFAPGAPAGGAAGVTASSGSVAAPEPDAGGGLPARPTLRWLVDADGLNLLAGLPGALARLPRASVLTPHPGEMARLTGLTVAEVQADRLGVASRAARDWGHVVALKGAFTVVAAPDGRVAVNPFANAALAKAGTGDVLAGVIAGLLAQAMAPFEAAVAGAFVHALAGELAADTVGARSLLAGDVLGHVADAFIELGG